MREYTIDKTASGFVNTMKKMGDDVRTDLEKVMNNVVEATFNSILDASPVDEGSYIASNRVSKGTERTDYYMKDLGGARGSGGRREAGKNYAKQEASDFGWKLGDDGVWFSNNVPHAIYVEDGSPSWTKTSPYKVYGHAQRRMENVYIPQEVTKAGL